MTKSSYPSKPNSGIGVLALQGCVDPHLERLRSLGINTLKVTTKHDLVNLDGIILPGGESTTMLRLLRRDGMFEALKEFANQKPTWGICAGAILLAQTVVSPEQESLDVMEIKATRNYYGSQIESFNTELTIPKISQTPISADFIRAPLLTPLSDRVETIATHNDQSVMLKQENLLACAFHVELHSELLLHKYFADMVYV